MSKNTIIKGTLILTIAGIATKLLGFYNRIFLTRLIGVKELGVYQLIFPLYLLAFSISCQGIATTLTKQVSFHMGRKCPNDARRVFRYSLFTSLAFSIVICMIMRHAAYPLSLYILKNTDCAPLVRIITIAVPFISVKACINSFFVGIDKPAYQGISHFVEQIFRIGVGYLLAALWSADRINAVLAVTAIVSGEIAATLLAVVFYRLYVKKNYRGKSADDPAMKESAFSTPSSILKRLFRDAVPITVNNVMLTLFSSFEAILMPAMLYYYYADSDTAMEMYGIVTGIVIPFLLFPSTITTSLSTMLLPAVSYASAKKDTRAIKSALANSVMFCLMLGACAWLGFILFGGFACEFAFGNKYAGTLLRKMSFLCPLIYLSGNLSAIMNGIDKAFQNLIFNIISIVIRILFSVTLVPTYGLSAYICGMAVSYLVLNILLLTSVRSIKKQN